MRFGGFAFALLCPLVAHAQQPHASQIINDIGISGSQCLARNVGNTTWIGAACSAAGGGDNVSVAGIGMSDVNFIDGDIDWTRTPVPPDQITATVACTDCVSYQELQNTTGADLLLGRGNGGGLGDVQEITLGANLTMAGTVLSASAAAGAPTTAEYITYANNGSLSADLFPSAADQVVVSDAVGSATWRGLVDSDGATQCLRFDTTTNAFSAGTHVGTSIETAEITDANVTYVKIQDVTAASRVLGRGSAAGAGDVEELTLGVGMSMTGTVLSAPSVSTNFNIDGDNNSPQTISDAEEALFVGGQGIFTRADSAPERITASFEYTDTRGANPIFNDRECVFTVEGASAGAILCEGISNTTEYTFTFPLLAADGATTVVTDTTDVLEVDGAGLTIVSSTLTVDSSETGFLSSSAFSPNNEASLVIDTTGDGVNIQNDTLEFLMGAEVFSIPAAREFPNLDGQALVHSDANDDWEWRDVQGRTRLLSDITCAVSASYCTIFTVSVPGQATGTALSAFILIETNSLTVAPQFRVRSADTGYEGYCRWEVTEAAPGTTTGPVYDNVSIGTAPADTGSTDWGSTSLTFVKVDCALLTDASPGDLVVEWQLETGTAPTQRVREGSYYYLTQTP